MAGSDAVVAVSSAGGAFVFMALVIIIYSICRRRTSDRTYSTDIQFAKLAEHSFAHSAEDITHHRLSSELFPFDASMLTARGVSLRSLPTTSSKHVSELPYAEAVTFFTQKSDAIGPVQPEMQVEWKPRVVTGFGVVGMTSETHTPLSTFGNAHTEYPVWTTVSSRPDTDAKQDLRPPASLPSNQIPILYTTIGDQPALHSSSMKRLSGHSSDLGDPSYSAINVNRAGSVHVHTRDPSSMKRLSGHSSDLGDPGYSGIKVNPYGSVHVHTRDTAF